MPAFEDATVSEASVEEVWKLLYDPTRFPEWWAGMETVDRPDDAEGQTMFTYYPTGYPDYPMPQLLDTARDEHRVVVSCLVSDLRFQWRLEPLDGDATRISVHVVIPEAEAHRLDGQRDVIRQSLRRLSATAAGSGRNVDSAAGRS